MNKQGVWSGTTDTPLTDEGRDQAKAAGRELQGKAIDCIVASPITRAHDTATIIAAEIDPLQTEGTLLRDKLTTAGVSVQYQLYAGTTHEFFGTYDVVPAANEAQTHAADRLKAAFQ